MLSIRSSIVQLCSTQSSFSRATENGYAKSCHIDIISMAFKEVTFPLKSKTTITGSPWNCHTSLINSITERLSAVGSYSRYHGHNSTNDENVFFSLWDHGMTFAIGTQTISYALFSRQESYCSCCRINRIFSRLMSGLEMKRITSLFLRTSTPTYYQTKFATSLEKNNNHLLYHN